MGTEDADATAEMVNKLIADAAAADEECERLRVNLRASLDAELEFKRKLDVAKIEADRYRLQRDFLKSMLPPDVDPFQSHAFFVFLARTLNDVEQQDERTAPGGHPTESDSDSD